MGTKTATGAKRDNVVVMDRDGVVVDDINAAFDKRFKEGNSLSERAFKELVFISMNIVPLRKKTILDKHDEIDPKAEAYMKRVQDNGKIIRVKTANRGIIAETEETTLEQHGIHAEVRYAGMLKKLDNKDTDERKLNEDNQIAALAALIRTGSSGKSITLIKKDYNSITGFFITLLGKHSRLNYADLDELND